jgi:hypothetical protein
VQHSTQPTERVRQESGDRLEGVSACGTVHGAASAPKSTHVMYNYRSHGERGRYRCFDPERHRPHQIRTDARQQPNAADVPQKTACRSASLTSA